MTTKPTKKTEKTKQKLTVSWISVDDKMPLSGLHVLVCCKTGMLSSLHYDIQNSYYNSGDLVWQDGWRKGQFFEITHWMPLPDLPILKELT